MKRILCMLLFFLICLTGCTTPQIEEPPVSPSPVVEPTPTPTQTQTVEPTPTPTQTVEPTPTPITPTVITFTRSNFPRLDGSTSTAPLGRAIASVLLGEGEEDVEDLIQFSRTSQSFRQLMWGNADLLIVAEPSPSVFESIDASDIELQMEPFAHDGLIFVVNADNPVDSLTVEQIQGIYSGEITNWSQVGGDDLPITPFQRNAESGSQVMMEKLVMDGLTMLEPLDGYMLSEMGTLMEAVRSYENTASAIGYSVYYYANDMKMADGLKILAVEGVTPSADTIRSGEYSLRNPYYVVKAANTPEDSMTSILYDWILSEDGQRLVNQMGYASVLEVAAEPAPDPTSDFQVTVHWDILEISQPETVLANRWYKEFTDDLIPSDEYGPLVPYIGGEISNPWWGNGWTYGLATLDGTIVTDAVFLHASCNSYYDIRSYTTVYPDPAVFELSKSVDGELRYGLAAGDGSWYTGLIYRNSLYTTPEGSLMEELSGDVVMIDRFGQEVFRWPADRIPLPNFRPNNFMMHRGGFSGRWVRYIDYDEEWNPIYYYIDLRSGTVYDTQPADWDDSEPYRDPDAITFGGGWYVTAKAGAPVELHLYSGETIQYPLPDGYKIGSVNGDRVLLYQGSSMRTCMLTDLEGNILAEKITDTPEFITNYGSNDPALICSTTYDPSYWHSWQLVRDRNGNELLTARDGSLTQFGSQLTFADDYYYRLTDLEGNDLIRIPRFTAND